MRRSQVEEHLARPVAIQREHGFDGAQAQREAVQFLLVSAVDKPHRVARRIHPGVALERLLRFGGPLVGLAEQFDLTFRRELREAGDADQPVGREFAGQGARLVDQAVDFRWRRGSRLDEASQECGNNSHGI